MTDPDLALKVFSAAATELVADLRRQLRHARLWALFWFACWALGVASRTWEALN